MESQKEIMKELIVADMSTIDPVRIQKDFRKDSLEFDISKLDIPVMGGPNVAITRTAGDDGIRRQRKI